MGGSKHTSVFILTYILTLCRHFSLSFLKCIILFFGFIFKNETFSEKSREDFIWGQEAHFSLFFVDFFCRQNFPWSWKWLQASERTLKKKKKAFQLIIAMVNYMKDILSLLGLNERVMIGLDRFPLLYVSISTDWLSHFSYWCTNSPGSGWLDFWPWSW